MNNYIINNDEEYAGLSYYGGYRTRTFADIFPSFEEFQEAYNSTPLKINFSQGASGLSLEQFFYMLYAHYGNSHIAYSDENQFIYYMWSIIYQHGPAVIKKREIQDELRAMNIEAIRTGSLEIYNHAFNPNNEPSTTSLQELEFINSQNTSRRQHSRFEAYTMLISVLEQDVVDDFIHKFKRLFIKVLAPDYPLLYSTEAN